MSVRARREETSRSSQACIKQSIRKRSVIVAGRLEPGDNRTTQVVEQSDEMIVLGPRVGHHQPPAATPPRHLDQDVIAVLGNVDSYQRGIRWRRLSSGHGRASPKW